MANSSRTLCNTGKLSGNPSCFNVCQFRRDLYHLCIDSIAEFTGIVSSLIIANSGWRDMLVISDEGQLRMNGLRWKLISSDDDIVAHIYNYEHLHGDYVNIIIDCPMNKTISIINQVCQARQLKHIYVNWLLLHGTIHIPSCVTRRPGDSAVFLNFKDSVASLKTWNYIVSELLLYSITQNPEPQIAIKYCKENCFSNETETVFLADYINCKDSGCQQYEFFNVFFAGFNGRELIVTANSMDSVSIATTMAWENMEMFIPQYNPFFEWSSPTTYYGIDYDILNILSKHLDFRFRIMKPPDGQWGSPKGNGSWTGLIGLLQDNEADVAVSCLSITKARTQVVDFSKAYWIERSAVAIKLESDNSLYFVYPLALNVYLVYFSLPFICGFLLWIYHLGNSDLQNNNLSKSLHFPMLVNAIGCLFRNSLSEQAELHPKFGNVGRTMQMCFWLCVIVVSATYRDSLVASLTVRRQEWPFNDIEGLAASDTYQLLLQNGTFREDLLRDSSSPVYQALWKKYLRQPKSLRIDNDTELFNILPMGPYAYTQDETYIKIRLRRLGDCDIVMLNEGYFPVEIALALPKKAIYTKYFNNVILTLLQAGLIQKSYDRHMLRDTCSAEPLGHTSVTVTDIAYVLTYVLGGGLGLSTAVLLLETLWAKTLILKSRIDIDS
ncbi:hypothetical protein CAPTEDRAFT_204388 [Capitella teleta]|uniref:Ionotropic glutamate receptor L-glutamate and glycine-binding domain-containing protein n=1 Tax=Capitella teleta TaxID=283909 RepID=R7U3Y4_CAPTE|nr:hypothetical protein CAPTEDRAFT_204388 [Capitella teleta]|eukprot:ELT97865.1 hypothetical protein CAPTEDRAFT_204388 [Capitella teleta]